MAAGCAPVGSRRRGGARASPRYPALRPALGRRPRRAALPGDWDTLVHASRPPLATNGIDDGYTVSVVPEGSTGWTGTPGLAGHRAGRAWSPKFVPTTIDIAQDDSAGGFVEVTAVDADAELEMRVVVELLPSGILRGRARVTNLADTPYALDALYDRSPSADASRHGHRHGGTLGERAGPAVTCPFTVGTHLREGRHGRTGADAATLLTAGTDDLDFGGGEGWGIHLAFSGNHRVLAERIYSGERVLMGGELLLPGEVELARGESYETPHLYASYGAGLDAIAARFHAHMHTRPAPPELASTVVMNVWEAVYFDHRLDRLVTLADLAAEVGVERFVLDDGSFGDRRGDSAGLGDWVVAEEVWGDGRFRDLVDAVKSRGMQFGLWFEPEGEASDSDLGRAHPGLADAGTGAPAGHCPSPAGARSDPSGRFRARVFAYRHARPRVRDRLRQVGSQSRSRGCGIHPLRARRRARSDACDVSTAGRDPTRLPRP